MKFAPDCVVKIVSKEWTMPVTVLGVNLCEKLSGASVLRNAVSPLRDCHVSSGSLRQLCNLPCFSFCVGCREAQRETEAQSQLPSFQLAHQVSFAFDSNLCVLCKQVFYLNIKTPLILFLRRECEYMHYISAQLLR